MSSRADKWAGVVASAHATRIEVERRLEAARPPDWQHPPYASASVTDNGRCLVRISDTFPHDPDTVIDFAKWILSTFDTGIP